MRRLATGMMMLGAAVMIAVSLQRAAAQDSDTREARAREMLRRAQEAVRELQSVNSDLSAGKLQAEQKLKTQADELEAARRESRSAQNSLRSQLQAATAAQADLTQKLSAATQQLAALTAKQRDTAGQLAEGESQLKQTQQELASSKSAGASCEVKNLKLYEYSQALLDRYRKKGVWAALTQKDPVFGIKEVGIENVVQEYQEKFDSQRIARKPSP